MISTSEIEKNLNNLQCIAEDELKTIHDTRTSELSIKINIWYNGYTDKEALKIWQTIANKAAKFALTLKSGNERADFLEHVRQQFLDELKSPSYLGEDIIATGVDSECEYDTKNTGKTFSLIDPVEINYHNQMKQSVYCKNEERA